ncbi:Kelch repeat-containing protein [Thermotalea metallivorans]|uniref:Uncharacterized protein n=1 Tax=Thermotalea metallivorans TaxID=520762 RepID=A0A140KZP5_9FIRM|nr:hypothetical protein [Thermotalea metallivorans]KXG73770.1 hypothetical protein AN619_29040 [Thermotalea metallivorans]
MKKRLVARTLVLAILLQIFFLIFPLGKSNVSYAHTIPAPYAEGDKIRIKYDEDTYYHMESKGIKVDERDTMQLVSADPVLGDYVLYQHTTNTHQLRVGVFNPNYTINGGSNITSPWKLIGKVEKIGGYQTDCKYTAELDMQRYDVIRLENFSVGPFPKNSYVYISSPQYSIGDYIAEKYQNNLYFIRQYDGITYPSRQILGKVEPFNDYIYMHSGTPMSIKASNVIENKYRFVRGAATPVGIEEGVALKDNRVAYLCNDGRFYIYDPRTDRWEQKSSFPRDTYFPNITGMFFSPTLAAINNNQIAAIGGAYEYGTNYNDANISDIFIYDIYTDAWIKRMEKILDSYPSKKAPAVLDDGRLFLAGGENRASSEWWSYSSLVQILNLSNKTTVTAEGQMASQGHGYTAMRAVKYKDNSNKEKVVFAGGYNRGYGQNNIGIFEYDPSTNQMIKKETLSNLNSSFNGLSGEIQVGQIGQDKLMFKNGSISGGMPYVYDANKNELSVLPILHESYYNAIKNSNLRTQMYTPDGTIIFLGADGYTWKAQPNKAPTVTINAPTNNQEIQKGRTLNIKWNAGDLDNDNLTYKVRVYTDTQEFYNGTPNAGFNNTSGQHNFDTSSIPLTWNASTGRYEQRVKVDVSVFDGVEGAVSTKEFIVINYDANGIVTTPATIHVVNLGDSFSLKLKVWDVAADRVTASASIDGKIRTATIDPTPTAMPTMDNLTLTWSGANALSAGTYTNISITITDSDGATKTITWNGTIIVMDLLTMVNNGISKTLLDSSYDYRFVMVNTESSIQNTTRNSGLLETIKNKLNSREQNALWLGQSGSKSYIDSKLILNNEYLYKSIPTDGKNDIINFIMSVITSDINGDTFLVGDTIETQMLFEDYEKDYEGISLIDKLKSNLELTDEQKKPKAGTTQIKYTHDPNIFDNPVPRHSKADEEWHNVVDMNDPFILKEATEDMRGLWTLSLQASDATKNPDFDKFATPKTKTFRVHTAPKAIANLFESPTDLYLSADESFDLDFQYSLPNNGIVKYEWFYELSDGSIHKFPTESKYVKIPKQIDGKNIVSFTLTVYDCYGAKDSTNIAWLLVPGIKAKIWPELSKFDIFGTGIPASEELKVTNIETIPYAMDRIEFALYKGATIKTPKVTKTNPTGLEISTPPYNKWYDIRNYRIPETLPDDIYTAKIQAIQEATVLELLWNIVVNTPINLQPSMSDTVRVGETYNIEATTSKYANKVEVIAFKGTPYESSVMTLSSTTTGDLKKWSIGYTIPNNLVDGVYTFEFKATTPNGNKETKTLSVKVISLQLTNFRITNIVNHDHLTYPITKDMLINSLVEYKTGYYVIFRINSKGKPNTVEAKIDIGHDGSVDQNVNLTKVGDSGTEEIWEGKFYTNARLPNNTIISLELIARKNTTTYNYNDKENWDGKALIIKGTALQDGRINLTN